MENEEIIKKVQDNYELVRDWLECKMMNKDLTSYLLERNIHSVVIYGGGDLGQLFLEEIKNSNVKCLYVLDNNADNLYLDVPVYPYSGQQIHADAVIVSAVFAYESVVEMLRKHNEIPMISLENIIHGV